jgi:hypothetical protein
MSKTLHTPETPRLGELILPQTKLAEFRRVDAESATAKFHTLLANKSIPKLFKHLDWQLPGETSSLDSFDTKLAGGNFILTAEQDDTMEAKSRNGKVNTRAEVDIEYVQASSFQVLRMEIEGRKGKGFRRELRLAVKFKQDDGCALLEAYMMTTGQRRGTLRLRYLPEPVQAVIEATDEQRQAALKIET